MVGVTGNVPTPLTLEEGRLVIVVMDYSTALRHIQITYLTTQPNNTLPHNNTGRTLTPRNMNSKDEHIHIYIYIYPTVYAADIDLIIPDMKSNTLGHDEFTNLLSGFPKSLKSTTVMYRPILGTWPEESSIQLMLLSLVILGSSSTAMMSSPAVQYQ